VVCNKQRQQQQQQQQQQPEATRDGMSLPATPNRKLYTFKPFDITLTLTYDFECELVRDFFSNLRIHQTKTTRYLQ